MGCINQRRLTARNADAGYMVAIDVRRTQSGPKSNEREASRQGPAEAERPPSPRSPRPPSPRAPETPLDEHDERNFEVPEPDEDRPSKKARKTEASEAPEAGPQRTVDKDGNITEINGRNMIVIDKNGNFIRASQTGGPSNLERLRVQMRARRGAASQDEPKAKRK